MGVAFSGPFYFLLCTTTYSLAIAYPSMEGKNTAGTSNQAPLMYSAPTVTFYSHEKAIIFLIVLLNIIWHN